jgi:3-oxoacyl-[acyl-carrier protein] reductase
VSLSSQTHNLVYKQRTTWRQRPSSKSTSRTRDQDASGRVTAAPSNAVDAASTRSPRGRGPNPQFDLNQLAQSAAQALAPSNVVVGVVAPGFVDTAMAAEVLNGERGDAIRGDSPFNRVASVDEVAEAVLYFTHTNAAWSSGAIIDVNGASYLRS